MPDLINLPRHVVSRGHPVFSLDFGSRALQGIRPYVSTEGSIVLSVRGVRAFLRLKIRVVLSSIILENSSPLRISYCLRLQKTIIIFRTGISGFEVTESSQLYNDVNAAADFEVHLAEGFKRHFSKEAVASDGDFYPHQ